MPSSVIEIRKARPMSGLGSTATIDVQGRLRCTARYETTNGLPKCALLLPVQAVNGRVHLVGRDGFPIADPVPKDIVYKAEPVVPAAGGDGDLVEINLPWPLARVTEALVILLHEQTEAVGDPKFRPADMVAVLRAANESELEDACDSGMASLATACCLRLRPSSELDDGIVRPPRALPDPQAVAVNATDAAGATDAAKSSDLAPGRSPAQPTSTGSAVCFAVASCQYPAGVLDGSVRSRNAVRSDDDIGPAERSLWRLARECESDRSIAAVFLTGDQVYVDATAGLFDPKAPLDRFGFAYRRLEANRGFQRLLSSGVSMFPMIDDHEGCDNWDAGSPPDMRQQARDYYIDRQRMKWPPPALQAGDPLWDHRVLMGFHFFLADTRSCRERRSPGNLHSATLMDATQTQALERMIDAQTDAEVPAFIVSPSMLLPRLLRLREDPAMCWHADSWCGYPRSLHGLLARIHAARAKNLVFLSGDEHVSSVTRITLRDDRWAVVLHSIHSSALYAPFPFANARQEDFAERETFVLNGGCNGVARPLECEVEVLQWMPGDGFTLVRPVRSQAGQWRLDLSFDREHGRRQHSIQLS